MDSFEPYFADDTQGVHFGVRVDGQLILAHVGRRVMAERFGVSADGHGWVAVYLAHRHEIDSVVTANVRANGPDTAILRLQDFT
ncbi:MAG: DUF1488 family protein [Betaproteobacteria bacterium]|nr:DUF1488 family protein [Betaproteobacteria bacterium]MBK7792644.1 DUF1488 family protein [Betaproteobacteria bacterium]